MKNTQDPYLARQLSVFSPWGVTPTSEFVCVLPYPDGDARRHNDLSWFGQEKALRPAGEGGLYYLAPKCLYRGEYKRGMECVCVCYCVCVKYRVVMSLVFYS